MSDTNLISPQDYVLGLEAEIARLRAEVEQLQQAFDSNLTAAENRLEDARRERDRFKRVYAISETERSKSDEMRDKAEAVVRAAEVVVFIHGPDIVSPDVSEHYRELKKALAVYRERA